jgi:hypothetical protein
MAVERSPSGLCGRTVRHVGDLTAPRTVTESIQ